MPTYTYECAKCGATMDIFHAISATPEVKCESCGSKRVKRLVGTGAGIIFKGSGFYETDYKKNGSQKKSDTGSEGKKETASDAKTDSKSESKSSETSSKPESKSTTSDSIASKK